MKKHILYLSVFLLAACTKQAAPEPVTETLTAGCPDTRVMLFDGVNAVWNAGDQVSVFYNGGNNECWNYTGADGAAKGQIAHQNITDRVGLGRFVALWPYDGGASVSGDVVSTTVPAVQPYRAGSYGWGLLLSKTEDNSLDFQYATAFVRLSLSGKGKIRSITLKGGNEEALSGIADVDISGAVPAATLSSGGSTLTLKKADDSVLETLSDAQETDFWLGLVPGVFAKGFVLTVTLESGSTEEITVSGPVTLKAGEAFCVHGRLFGFETIIIDFVSNPGAFSPQLPSSMSTTEGTHTYTAGGESYTLTFHPAYDAAWYGYGYYTHAEFGKSLLIGRKTGWIRLPVKSGYALYEVEYTAGSTSGYPFLSDSTYDPFGHMLSNQVSATTGNTNYSMTVEKTVKNKQYYLVVGAGNLLIKKMILRYKKVD